MSTEPLRAVPEGEEVTDVLCQAARRYADLLGLRNHTVEVLEEAPKDPGSLAEVELAAGRAHIRLRFHEDFPLMSADEQRLALTHEMLHPHLQKLTERVEEVFREHVGGVAFRVFWLGFVADTEGVVDGLATAIAPQMPHIEW